MMHREGQRMRVGEPTVSQTWSPACDGGPWLLSVASIRCISYANRGDAAMTRRLCVSMRSALDDHLQRDAHRTFISFIERHALAGCIVSNVKHGAEFTAQG